MVKRPVILVLLFLASLSIRIADLGKNGFSDDEARKMLATQQYRNGDFTANGEHPMLMKFLSTACVITVEKWNALVPSAPISMEAAVRFPSALAGSLSVPAIYLIALELFNPNCALIAATLWAFDINGIALSRVAKEDPLITLFFILGNFFLLRGKRYHFDLSEEARKCYILCGASFGALFASKYFIPYPWVTLVFYDVFRFRKEPRWRIDASTLRKLYLAFVLVFLLLNPVVLSPSMWSYYWGFFTHKAVTHSGYFMMGQIYLNKAYYTFWGQPPYYYLLFLWVKVPAPLLICFVTGLVYTFRRFREDRFLFVALYFVIWTFLISLPGGKFTRYYTTLLPVVILLQSLGIYLIYTATKSFLEKREKGYLAPAVMAILLLSTAGWQLINMWKLYPDYSFYVTSQAGGESRRGYYFPQDEFYDAGLREGIRYIAGNAPQSSQVIGSTPAVFEYYSKLYGRTDLRFISMANKQFVYDPREEYSVLAQRNYRTYLENEYILTFVYAELNALFVSSVKGVPSVEVFRLASRKPYARAPYWRARRWPGQLKLLSRNRNREIL